ncbi:hypothetical protein GCM10027048_44400 [Hymenobacter coalescens]
MLNHYVLAALLLIGISTASQAQEATPAPPSDPPATAVGGPVPANVEDFVRHETKGGELDFDKILAAKKQTVFLHDGNMYSKREYALVLWGMRVKALGLPSAERACAVYALASNRTLSPAEKRALTNGFESGSQE